MEVSPGIMGGLQALETIKLMLEIGQPLIGQLILFDVPDMEFHSLYFARDIASLVCGKSPKIEEPVPALAG